MFTMDDLLEIAIKMEKNGESIYADSVGKIDSRQLKETLEWMAAEEAGHAKWFSHLRNDLKLKVDESNLKQMVPKVLQDMMGEKTLSLEEVDFSTINTVDDLFKTFIGFEKDTIIFYELLEMFIEDPAVLDGLKTIIREEKKHIQALEDRMKTFSGELILP